MDAQEAGMLFVPNGKSPHLPNRRPPDDGANGVSPMDSGGLWIQDELAASRDHDDTERKPENGYPSLLQ